MCIFSKAVFIFTPYKTLVIYLAFPGRSALFQRINIVQKEGIYQSMINLLTTFLDIVFQSETCLNCTLLIFFTHLPNPLSHALVLCSVVLEVFVKLVLTCGMSLVIQTQNYTFGRHIFLTLMVFQASRSALVRI